VCEIKSLKGTDYVCITSSLPTTTMPSAVIRDVALEMMKAIDRTNPSEYSTNDEYARDYRLRWSAAMELLRYAEHATDLEDDYTDDDDDESVASNDIEDEDYDTETSDEDFEEVNSAPDPTAPRPRRSYQAIDDESDNESVYAQY
jgi:hypothetical protein